MVVEIVSYSWDKWILGPLLLPNLLLYGAIVVLSAGYVVQLRFPQLYYYLSLGVLAAVGVGAIVIGWMVLRELPALTTISSFVDLVVIICAYSSATLLTVLGMLAILYLVKVFLAKKISPSEEHMKSSEEIEILPHNSDDTDAR